MRYNYACSYGKRNTSFFLFLFYRKKGFDISCKQTICMTDQILFSWKNKKKVINFSSAKLAKGKEVDNFVLSIFTKQSIVSIEIPTADVKRSIFNSVLTSLKISRSTLTDICTNRTQQNIAFRLTEFSKIC